MNKLSSQDSLTQSEELILHSFSLLKNLKQCVDTIFSKENMSLSSSRFLPTNKRSSSAAEYEKSGFCILLEVESNRERYLTYQINNPEVLGSISSFKPESQDSVRWLCENFNMDKQRFDNLIFKKNAKIFIESFIEELNTQESPHISFKEMLTTALNNIDNVVALFNRLDENEFQSWIDTYFILEEKQRINEALGSGSFEAQAKGKFSLKI